MIGLIRAHFSVVIPSSYKHGHFELHDNVITVLPIVICIGPECRNRRDEKHKEQQRKTQTEVFRITYNLSHGQFLEFSFYYLQALGDRGHKFCNVWPISLWMISTQFTQI